MLFLQGSFLSMSFQDISLSKLSYYCLVFDGVAMGSPLRPVIAGIFVVELERTLLPKLTEHMTPWKQYCILLQ